MTKIVAMTRSADLRPSRTSCRWPSCSAPMVGTRATVSPAARYPRTMARSASTVSAIAGCDDRAALMMGPSDYLDLAGDFAPDFARDFGAESAADLTADLAEDAGDFAGPMPKQCSGAGNWPLRTSRA
ncbi:hypothetical protein CHELA20_52792 [Hyphomicrobiales bacterium]|nr:hypothetical protein CHELA41_22133 [Hyphomicrobiales bacterium]CAH1682934.1 hypothetical protein CHELA20_52792 [Hyphomicrobiales bacterium]